MPGAAGRSARTGRRRGRERRGSWRRRRRAHGRWDPGGRGAAGDDEHEIRFRAVSPLLLLRFSSFRLRERPSSLRRWRWRRRRGGEGERKASFFYPETRRKTRCGRWFRFGAHGITGLAKGFFGQCGWIRSSLTTSPARADSLYFPPWSAVTQPFGGCNYERRCELERVRSGSTYCFSTK